jgi:hypothetical protein
MYIWFARKPSLMGWLNRVLLVMVVAVMVGQIISKPALAAPADTQQQGSTPQAQEVQQSTPPLWNSRSRRLHR